MSDGLLPEVDLPAARLRLEALRTRMHTWRAAAVMTCLLTPVGLLFGLAGLLALGRVGSLIVAGREQEARERLDLAQKITLIGTALAVLVTLVGFARFIGLALDLAAQFEQLPQRGGRYW